MALPSQLILLKERPSMFMVKVDYYSIVAFVQGYDSALCNCFLSGFQEWLVVKTSYGPNLAWFQIILKRAFPDVESPFEHLRTEGVDAAAITALFDSLEEFCDIRNQHGGLESIYLRHADWCKENGISASE